MIKMLIFDLKDSEKDFFKNDFYTDFDITFFKESLNEETKLTINECDETVILCVYSTSKVTHKVLEKFKNLRVIALRSNNYDNIDIPVCRDRNIAVMNVSENENNSIAQYVIGTIFSMTRNLISASIDFKDKIKNYEQYEGRDINNLKLGVIGTGKIGSSVCKLANQLGMKIFANDYIINRDLTDFVEYLPLIEVLRLSDVISIHIPYNKDFHHLISYKEFEIMKDGSYIINTSHGKLINTMALYKAIQTGKLNGAALDVLECGNLYMNMQNFYETHKGLKYDYLKTLLVIQELIKSPKVIITPHISYNTKDSAQKILKLTFNNIKDYYKGLHTNRIV